MSIIVAFFRNNPWYLPAFLVGFLSALPYSGPEIHAALEITGVLMLVALFASLLVPFAGFSREEALNKWWLVNAPILTFGAYACEVIKQPSVLKMILLIAVMGMHIAYWTSSLHSRNYRLDQLRLSGLAEKHPEEMAQIARLNANGRSGEADEIVRKILAIE